MKFQNRKWMLRILLMVIMCWMIAGCNSDLFKSKEVPVITDFSADAYEVDPGDTVRVSVRVKDGSDAALQYKWSANGGQFIPPVNQSDVLWKAPEEGGDYQLKVVVSNADGDSDPHSDVIHVRAKEPPEILSMELSDYEVDPGDTVQIIVTLKDMDDPTLDYDWTANGGQFLALANQDTVLWKAPAVGGKYQIDLIVSNSEKISDPRSETITVRSYAAPYVEITSPAADALFRQHDVLEVTAIANHQNSIELVNLYVNDVLNATLNGGTSEEYQFNCELAGPEGITKIRVEAVANITGVIGSDELQVRVEGIVLGK